MSIPSLKALKEISDLLTQAGIKHALGGTGLLYSYGLIGEVKDWDITLDAPFEQVCEAIRNFKWERVGQKEPFYSDYLLKINLEGTHIELIGRFKIRNGQEDFEVPVVVSQVWNGIPIADPEAWFQAYTLMGRKNRADLLADFLKLKK